MGLPSLPLRHAARLAAAGLALSGLHAAAADAPVSELQVAVWAASCMACHGTDGRAGSAGLAIAGRPADALLSAMRSFRSGQRSATVMHQHVHGYSDHELALIAGYFSRRPER